MEQTTRATGLDTKHIPALDGLRAVAIFIIAWYHIWQQSWLSPTFRLHNPFTGRLQTVSLDIWPRTGYLFVDLMLLLSAFCLFLPHARTMLLGAPLQSTRRFYEKRLARILPSYWLCVIVLAVVAVVEGAWTNLGAALGDLFATLTFTQTLSAETYLHTKINGVLWTAAIEMQFYLIFPLLAACFRKKPLLTFGGLLLAQEAYLRGYVLTHPDTLRLTFNQLPAFFGVFALGMMAALLYVAAAKRLEGRDTRLLVLPSLAGLALSLYFLDKLQHGAAGAANVQVFQAAYRMPLALVFTLLLLSLCFGGKLFALVFGNRVMRFFAAISYNLYIWHQWLAVRLKQWRIPYWEGTELPNFTGNRVWQERYTLVVFIAAIAVAALLTYLWERPAHRRLLAARPAAEVVPANTGAAGEFTER